MKIFIKFLLFLYLQFFTNLIFAQCPTGNITLTTQKEVDEFVTSYPNCDIIDGSLIIKGIGITNISTISNIKEVKGDFIIKETHLSEFNFSQLESTTNLLFYLNTKLVSIRVNKINSLGGQLFIEKNYALKTINLPILNSIKNGIKVFYNPELVSINLKNLTSFDGIIHISKNMKLSSLSFENIKTSTASLIFENNSSLKQISLPNIPASGELNCTDNPLLESLDLKKIVELVSVNISNNPQLKVFNLLNLSSLSGKLDITNTALINLNLSNLLEGGNNNFNISNNPELTTINLKKVKKIGNNPFYGLKISFNYNLTSLNLNNLEIVHGGFSIHDNTSLEFLKLSKLKGVLGQTQNISNNTKLKMIDMENLITVADNTVFKNNSELEHLILPRLEGGISNPSITIEENIKLKSIDLNNLGSNPSNHTIGDLNIINNPMLTNLNVCRLEKANNTNVNLLQNISLSTICFDKLSSVISIKIDQSNLENLDTFQNLKSIGDLIILNNLILNQVNLPNLKYVYGHLHFINNLLTNFDLTSLEVIKKTIIIKKNAGLLNINLASLYQAGDLDYPKFHIIDNAHLNSIQINKLLLSRELEIRKNPELTSINFDKLYYISTFYSGIKIINNRKLTSIHFDNLKTIRGLKSDGLMIIENPVIKQLNFPSLYYAEKINIRNNVKLNKISLDGLSTGSLAYGFRYFEIVGNPNLISISACNLDTNINVSNMLISNNLKLNSLCFDELRYISSIIIEHSNLENLNAFIKLSHVHKNLTISNNPHLKDCSALCRALTDNDVSITIINNPSSCSSETEIRDTCNALDIEDVNSNRLTIYPNPTQGIIHFNNDLTAFRYSIFDVLGRILKKDNLKNNTIDISNLKKGLYYLILFKGGSHVKYKAIIKKID